MCHGKKELTAVFTRFYQALIIIMHIQVVYCESSSLNPRGVDFQ